MRPHEPTATLLSVASSRAMALVTLAAVGRQRIADALTDAYNRRSCEERLTEEAASAERGREALALAAVDLAT